MKKIIENILILIFIFRPVIDLFWDGNILFGLNLAGLVSIFLIFLCILYFIINKKIYVNGVSCSAILFIILSFFVTTISANSIADFDFTLRVFSSFTFYLVLVPVINKEKFDKCLIGFLIISTIPIFVTYLQRFGIVDYTYFDYVNGIRIARGSGGYRQPSVLTRFCIFGLLYALYYLEIKWKNIKIKKIFAYIYIILNIIAIFLSYHRTGYLLAIITVGYWMFLRYKKNIAKLWLKIIVGIVLGISIFILLYINGAFSIDLSIFKDMLSIDNIFIIENGKFELVLRGRGTLIQTLIEGIKDNPWYHTLFGNGIDVNNISGISMNFADMDFIRIIWNCGFVGFGIWISHLHYIRKDIKIISKKNSMDPLVRLAKCTFIIFIIWGFTIEATSTPNLMYHFYLICGFAYYYNKRKNTTS